MPDKYNFNHLPNRGRAITVACIEDGCNTSGPIYYFTEELRLQHYLAHQTRQRREDDFDLDSLPTTTLNLARNNAQQSPAAQTPTAPGNPPSGSLERVSDA